MKKSTWLFSKVWETKENKRRLSMGRPRNYEAGLYNDKEQSLTIYVNNLQIENLTKEL